MIFYRLWLRLRRSFGFDPNYHCHHCRGTGELVTMYVGCHYCRGTGRRAALPRAQLL